MPYSAPWMTNRCRCSPPQPNAVCTMVCRSATVLSPETSSRRQISGLTACSTARNRYTPGDAAGSDTTSPVGTSSSGTAPSSPLAMLATVVRVGAGGQRDRRPRRGGPAPGTGVALQRPHRGMPGAGQQHRCVGSRPRHRGSAQSAGISRAYDGGRLTASATPRTRRAHAAFGVHPLMGYLPGVSNLTSVKIPIEVRDRFAAAAEVRGITVRALLDQLSCQVEDAALMEQAARQMRQLREVDPEAWGNYLTEGGQWEEATIERLDA